MTLRYRVALTPSNRTQRPGYAMKGGRASSITVHSTATVNAPADNFARYHARENLNASWHITVDDVEAVLHIPLSEQAWHTGTSAGNTTSIGIEVAEFSDRKRAEAAEANAQQLIADMLAGKAPGPFSATWLKLSDVRTHQSWNQYGTSGKYCPRTLLPWWDEFIAGIARRMGEQQRVTYEVGLFHCAAADVRRYYALAVELGCAIASDPCGTSHSEKDFNIALARIATASSVPTVFGPGCAHAVVAVHAPSLSVARFVDLADKLSDGRWTLLAGMQVVAAKDHTEGLYRMLAGASASDVFKD